MTGEAGQWIGDPRFPRSLSSILASISNRISAAGRRPELSPAYYWHMNISGQFISPVSAAHEPHPVRHSHPIPAKNSARNTKPPTKRKQRAGRGKGKPREPISNPLRPGRNPLIAARKPPAQAPSIINIYTEPCLHFRNFPLKLEVLAMSYCFTARPITLTTPVVSIIVVVVSGPV